MSRQRALRAFLRSVMAWQEAMLAAGRQPNAFELFSGVDLEDAASSTPGAKRWLDAITRAHASATDVLRQSELLGCDEGALAKYRALVLHLGFALRAAEEHLADLIRKRAPPAP